MRIVAPGVRAIVVDRGRFGHLRDGVPPSGPADPFAFAAAQVLAGNDPGADAALEIVGSPFAFACTDRRLVAVAGRDVRLRGRDPLPGWTTVFARAGDELTVVMGERSRFAYLAVSGGIATPAVLGSRASYLPAGIGRALRAGDELPLGEARVDPSHAGRRIRELEYQDEEVRTITGPHAGRFTEEARNAFFSSTFVVAPQSDRMATRLEGQPVASDAREILTCGVVAGAVQIPRGGSPIVLLADHQTTGGYPVIATVIAADLGRLAQRLPGERLRFTRVERDRALAALRESRDSLVPSA